MWTIAAANKRLQGPLGSYNGLTDIHLAHYFSSPAKMSHLKEANLITSDGAIIPEQIYKVETLKHEKKRHLYDFLARNIIQNAAMEESCCNKKLLNYLEDISKMQVVENTKVDKKKLGRNLSLSLNKMRATIVPGNLSGIQDNAKNFKKKFNTFQQPRSALSSAEYIRRSGSLLQSNFSKLKRCYSAKNSSPYTFPMFWCSNDRNQIPFTVSTGINFIKRKRRKQVHPNLDSKPKSLNCTNKVSSTLKNISLDQCKVTLFYHGHGVVSYFRKEIVIKQQHCGGTSVTVFKGDIAPSETITFTSLTHEGFPFNVTIFLDGIRDLKLSSCCVFRYTLRKRLGGLSGNFSIEAIAGGKKCLKCQYLEMVSCNNNLRRELVSSEDKAKVDVSNSVMQGDKTIDEELESTKDVIPDFENSLSQLDGSSISIRSETNSKLDDDIEENLSARSELQISESEAHIPEEHQLKKTDINVAEDSNFDSESSIISLEDSIADDIKQNNFETNNYQSENSSEDENGKEHLVLASVHNLPS